jgi:hypothetical protein
LRDTPDELHKHFLPGGAAPEAVDNAVVEEALEPIRDDPGGPRIGELGVEIKNKCGK